MKTKITYGITVCDEYEELNNLLNFLLLHIDNNDEVVVLKDTSKTNYNVHHVVFKYIRAFKEKGISYIDLLSVMFNRYPKTMSRRMRRQLDKKLYDMMDLLDEEHMNQYEEINLMIENDVAC
jgi:hypothetical protein